MHSEKDFHEAVAALKIKLEAHHGDFITGSKVGEILIDQCKFRLKNLDQPKLTLSQLIKHHLSDTLTAYSSQGGDTLYFVGRGAQPLMAQPEYRFWTAFAKADEQCLLAVRESDSEPVIVEGGASSAGLKVLPKVTLSDIEAIKASFVDAYVVEPGQSPLPSADIPYLQWVADLRASSYQQMSAWSLYRIKHIKQLFKDRLSDLGVQETDQARLERFLSESQRTKIRPATAARDDQEAHSVTLTHGTRNPRNPDQVFRDAVVAVISQLSMSELRELKLPAGLLSDALQVGQ
ncbi:MULTISPECIES: hypothetical protein [Pseudomonas syringae group genomosp. 2]|uniref:Uncharacterized protein n=1 Tax=Pseudomonas amygdali pv. tabaci TaxID=322 RepID=A0A3M6GDT0_PSEAJ|nr:MULTISPECIES: hypothetical protein [Pseudomonas syringae group genomosp. 2]QOI07283.1 hypothetical protein D5S10_27740 [Pseudomonas savastanoi]RMV90604.1 hypothetical protein ALP03_200226 [Pseudomonas amygdali pv. tabaci]